MLEIVERNFQEIDSWEIKATEGTFINYVIVGWRLSENVLQMGRKRGWGNQENFCYVIYERPLAISFQLTDPACIANQYYLHNLCICTQCFYFSLANAFVKKDS